jgi:uncharacterized GH25 family protein
MLRIGLLLSATLTLLVGASAGPAHELKVLASRLALAEPGGRSTVYLSWGDYLPVHDLVDARSLERYDLVAPGGATTALKRSDLSLQANAVTLGTGGLYRVIATRQPAVLTFVATADGSRRLHFGPKTSATGGTVDHAWRSQQFAKALIVAGPADAATDEPAGLPVEIVPLGRAGDWRSGRDLRFQVLFQGKPLAEEHVRATYVGFQPDDAWCYTAATDRTGVVRVRPSRAGTWVLCVNVRRAAADAVRGEYDYESYTASLTLEIRP